MDKDTHVIKVVLESGVVLETGAFFSDTYTPEDLNDEIFEDKTSTWKDAGDIRFRFRDLAAIQLVEL